MKTSTQKTLVALYGPKEKNFQHFIQNIWNLIKQSPLHQYFKPYQLPQIHATIIGLEKFVEEGKIYNANIWKKKGRKQEMNFEGFIDTFNSFFPMTIQFGGFEETYDAFRSLDQKAFIRSFQINETTGQLVLIGWPINKKTGKVENQLLLLRDSLFFKHQILHKYQKDNDFFLVLGHLDGDQEFKEEILRLNETIRRYLLKNPIQFTVTDKDLSIVQYEKETLEIASSQQWTLKDFNKVKFC